MTQSTQPVTDTSKFTAKIKNKHQHHSAALRCSSPCDPQSAEAAEDHATLLYKKSNCTQDAP